MLKTFRADNFKSLVNFEISPVGLNLLVGPNNAGKTNICQALQFLALTARLPVDEAASTCTAEPWNLMNVYEDRRALSLAVTCEVDVDSESLAFSYELDVGTRATRTGGKGTPLEVQRELLKVSGGRFSDKTLLENARGRVRLLHESRFLKGLSGGPESEYVETVSPPDSTMLYRLFDLETNKRANAFKRYLGAWEYYNFDSKQLRGKQAKLMDMALESDGSNLSSVLYALHNAAPRLERKLIDVLKVIEPKLDILSFQSPDPEHVYMFFEDKAGNRFGVDSASDGTLRYLAISCILLAGRELARQVHTPPVIMIEEPENGLFVGYLRELFEQIEPSGHDGQFVFTSHNPYFIDLFDATLSGLFVAKQGDRYTQLVKPDPAALQRKLGEFSLGEMHFRGLLE